MRKTVRRIVMTHDDTLNYSIAANIVLTIILIFAFSNALFSGAMIWYLIGIVCLYYLVAVGIPVLIRLLKEENSKKPSGTKHKKNS